MAIILGDVFGQQADRSELVLRRSFDADLQRPQILHSGPGVAVIAPMKHVTGFFPSSEPLNFEVSGVLYVSRADAAKLVETGAVSETDMFDRLNDATREASSRNQKTLSACQERLRNESTKSPPEQITQWDAIDVDEVYRMALADGRYAHEPAKPVISASSPFTQTPRV